MDANSMALQQQKMHVKNWYYNSLSTVSKHVLQFLLTIKYETKKEI